MAGNAPVTANAEKAAALGNLLSKSAEMFQRANLSEITIGIPSVTNGGNVDHVCGIINSVDHSKVANPYSPKAPVTLAT